MDITNKEKFDNVYKCEKNEFAEGGFSEVFKCTHRRTGEKAAAKHNYFDFDAFDEDHEAIALRILLKCSHENILKVFDFFDESTDEETHTYMIMEYLPGGELYNKLVEEKFLSEATTKFYLKQIFEALRYLHGELKIAHLDLKPENMVLKDNNTVKLIDFGLSHDFSDGKVFKNKDGTDAFMAPEQHSEEELGFFTDMWAMGVIVYQLLIGLCPFGGKSKKRDEIAPVIKKGVYNWENPNIDPAPVVSEKAKQFVSELLIIEGDKRKTAAECLKPGTWLTTRTMKKAQVSTAGLKQFQEEQERLRKEKIREKWCKSAEIGLKRQRKQQMLDRLERDAAQRRKRKIQPAQNAEDDGPVTKKKPAERNGLPVAKTVEALRRSPRKKSIVDIYMGSTANESGIRRSPRIRNQFEAKKQEDLYDGQPIETESPRRKRGADLVDLYMWSVTHYV